MAERRKERRKIDPILNRRRMNRREWQRIPIDIWVETHKKNELYFQKTANISLGGVYLENTIPHPLGTAVLIKFKLSNSEKEILVKGQIVNIKGDELGMGIKFVNLTEETSQLIQEFIAAGSPTNDLLTSQPPK